MTLPVPRPGSPRESLSLEKRPLFGLPAPSQTPSALEVKRSSQVRPVGRMRTRRAPAPGGGGTARSRAETWLCFTWRFCRPPAYQQRLQGRAGPAGQNQQDDVGQEAGHVHQAGAEGSRVRLAEEGAQAVTQHDDRHPKVQQEEEDDEGIAVCEDAACSQNDRQGGAADAHHGQALQEPGQEAGSRVQPHHPQVLSGEGDPVMAAVAAPGTQPQAARQPVLRLPCVPRKPRRFLPHCAQGP